MIAFFNFFPFVKNTNTLPSKTKSFLDWVVYCHRILIFALHVSNSFRLPEHYTLWVILKVTNWFVLNELWEIFLKYLEVMNEFVIWFTLYWRKWGNRILNTVMPFLCTNVWKGLFANVLHLSEVSRPFLLLFGYRMTFSNDFHFDFQALFCFSSILV